MSKENYTNFSNKIRVVRLSQGISQKELARRANICQGQLCNLEKERLRPWPIVIHKLAKALKVGTETLCPDNPLVKNKVGV